MVILAPDTDKDTLSTGLRQKRAKNHSPSEIWLKFRVPVPLHSISLQASSVPSLNPFTNFFQKSIPPNHFTSSVILPKIQCQLRVLTSQRTVTQHLPSWEQPLLSLQSNRKSVPFVLQLKFLPKKSRGRNCFNNLPWRLSFWYQVKKRANSCLIQINFFVKYEENSFGKSSFAWNCVERSFISVARVWNIAKAFLLALPT